MNRPLWKAASWSWNACFEEAGKSPETYRIVGAAEANPKEGLISNESPVGRALLDHKVGDEVSVDVPAGELILRIKKIK